MKLFIFNKKHILFFCILILAISTIYYFSRYSFSIAVDFSSNSSISDDFKEKITNLTKNNEKIAYLTFDDGPSKNATPKILDILKEENVKASFFEIGKYVARYPEITKRAYEEGHFIANHGYDHNNSNLYASEESFKNEILRTDMEIGKAIGIPEYCSHVFRFPNGYMSPNNKYQKKKAVELLKNMNYTYIDWNCLNNDSVGKFNNYQLLNNLKKTSKDKGTLVVLMHDTTDVSNSSLVLKDSIHYLREQGYSFKNFYDLLNNS